MKWITIDKAKPKFDQQYLVSDGYQAEIAYLESSTSTSTGVKHKFNGSAVPYPSHIAAVTAPEKEVDNG